MKDVPSRSANISPNARWVQNGVTIAPVNGEDDSINELRFPRGLYVDTDQTVYVADRLHSRVVRCKCNSTKFEVVVGRNDEEREDCQLGLPVDVIIDNEGEHLIISDSENRRVVRWPRENGKNGEIIIADIDCTGLTMDINGSLYVADKEKHQVKRYRLHESEGEVVAGGDWLGYGLDRLYSPSFLFVDRDHSVYVSDYGNHRVVKWEKGAKEGIVVAGGNGEGDALTQLKCPEGIIVDQMGTVYVADSLNNRVMRWPRGATQGDVIVGGNGEGQQANQLNTPAGLAFDQQNNLYVVDWANDRVQKFNIDTDS